MAPELFQEGGSYSSASDLWALGCVLYQLAVGHPPFVAGEFSQLVSDVLNTQPGPIPGQPWSQGQICLGPALIRTLTLTFTLILP
jgi:serine/threonine protein kinase